jgi:hypothetical protein
MEKFEKMRKKSIKKDFPRKEIIAPEDHRYAEQQALRYPRKIGSEG